MGKKRYRHWSSHAASNKKWFTTAEQLASFTTSIETILNDEIDISRLRSLLVNTFNTLPMLVIAGAIDFRILITSPAF
jgi:hypothetical protein